MARLLQMKIRIKAKRLRSLCRNLVCFRPETWLNTSSACICWRTAQKAGQGRHGRFVGFGNFVGFAGCIWQPSSSFEQRHLNVAQRVGHCNMCHICVGTMLVVKRGKPLTIHTDKPRLISAGEIHQDVVTKDRSVGTKEVTGVWPMWPASLGLLLTPEAVQHGIADNLPPLRACTPMKSEVTRRALQINEEGVIRLGRLRVTFVPPLSLHSNGFSILYRLSHLKFTGKSLKFSACCMPRMGLGSSRGD
mmetsp:Transcript_67955/g.124073  ORF Transcript_67955/g.124073 Transcript_67955/m.124073 type:complete len:248 (-) Transcript_67955:1718-2461(-)